MLDQVKITNIQMATINYKTITRLISKRGYNLVNNANENSFQNKSVCHIKSSNIFTTVSKNLKVLTLFKKNQILNTFTTNMNTSGSIYIFKKKILLKVI